MIEPSSILAILENPFGRDWTVQGLGMLRLYLDEPRDWRMNIWHSSLASVGVSRMHDHPWNFESHVICGRIRNTRYIEVTDGTGDTQMQHSRLHCSKVGELEGPVTIRDLITGATESYGPGDTYTQTANEIHLSAAADGTITLLRRNRLGTNEHASVYWPLGRPFGDARKSPPTDEEIGRVCDAAAFLLRMEIPA